MAASANPTGNNQEGLSNQKVTAPPTIANGISLISNSSEANTSARAAGLADTQAALRHNPGISKNWTPDEQSILEDLLAKYASDSTIVRYAKIAMRLKDKTVRDVALRCRWMTKKENGKRRKEDHISTRKSKDRRIFPDGIRRFLPGSSLLLFKLRFASKFLDTLLDFFIVQVDKDIVSQERSTDSLAKSTSVLTARPNGPSYVPPITQMDNDDGIPYEAFWGATGELLDQNAQIFNQISANFSAFQVKHTVHVYICPALFSVDIF
ncbi:F21O3.28 protein isoform 3 [Gossypium australe]|uniref:F21O3.28 protein isoform 3 n=1 Tax=Gossypium australe TaxID=47621 RepID=A0A5B6W0B5_9ROSI|nr:F21O3.28 protein isoform 3 [Gossypium australe]